MRFAILILPWLELLTLIQLGIETSALTAIVYVFVTLLIGITLLQRQGRGMFERLRQAQDGRMLGPQILVDDMALGFAGLLLVIPGMISDFTALVILIGPIRRRLFRILWGRSVSVPAPGETARTPETIEGEYRRIDGDDNS